MVCAVPSSLHGSPLSLPLTFTVHTTASDIIPTHRLKRPPLSSPLSTVPHLYRCLYHLPHTHTAHPALSLTLKSSHRQNPQCKLSVLLCHPGARRLPACQHCCLCPCHLPTSYYHHSQCPHHPPSGPHCRQRSQDQPTWRPWSLHLAPLPPESTLHPSS